MATGGPVEWTPDVVAHPGTYAQYVAGTEEWLKSWPVKRPIDRFPLYSVEIPLLGYVAP